MKFTQITLADGPQPFDVVIVIDVCRAFTTAAYALARGVERIVLVSTVEEALTLKQKNPAWRVMGETDGLPVEGFDYWNSPSELAPLDLGGVTLVQRTTAGTQGVAMWQNTGIAPRLFAASFAVAGATAKAVQALRPHTVGFVVTGLRPPVFSGDEDVACADYLQALLEGKNPLVAPYLQRARSWNVKRLALDALRSRQIADDLELCLQTDTFDFAMPVCPAEGQMILESWFPPSSTAAP